MWFSLCVIPGCRKWQRLIHRYRSGPYWCVYVCVYLGKLCREILPFGNPLSNFAMEVLIALKQQLDILFSQTPILDRPDFGSSYWLSVSQAVSYWSWGNSITHTRKRQWIWIVFMAFLTHPFPPLWRAMTYYSQNESARRYSCSLLEGKRKTPLR